MLSLFSKEEWKSFLLIHIGWLQVVYRFFPVYFIGLYYSVNEIVELEKYEIVFAVINILFSNVIKQFFLEKRNCWVGFKVIYVVQFCIVLGVCLTDLDKPTKIKYSYFVSKYNMKYSGVNMKKLIITLIVANILCGSYILWNMDYAQTKPTIIVVDVPVLTTISQPNHKKPIPIESILRVEDYPEVSIVKTYKVPKTQSTLKTNGTTVVNNFSRHTRPDSSFVYYDFIPLSRELQEFTWMVSREYNIDVLLVYAVMKLESRFTTDLVSADGNDFGLMQINKVNHQWLSDKLGITDYLNPYDNIVAGVYMLRHALNEGDNLHTSLMVYNCGIGRAKELWAEDIYSNTYSHIVVNSYEEYLNEAEH